MGPVDFTVIIASDRTDGDLNGCLAALARQKDAPPFEVLVVSAVEPSPPTSLLAGWVRMTERNPGARRNRAAAFAAGRTLAFVDDDACPREDWLARAAQNAARCSIFGGRDPGPPSAPWRERISDLLLSTPGIGSAVAAHERRPKEGPVRRPSAISLCNLFVSRELFDRLDGFDERFGYIGEDTDFVKRAMDAGGAPELDPGLVVFHRRRPFPGPFLAQRWRYRFKTGRLLAERPELYPVWPIAAFLGAGAGGIALTALFGAAFLGPAAAAYFALVLTASAPIWARDPSLFPAAVLAFPLHHANYWLATATGLASGLLRRVVPRRRAQTPATRPPAPPSLPTVSR